MLRIDIHAGPQAATLHCKGRVVLGLEAETLRCMAESRTEPSLILDLREICAMDATGLGLLVELHCRAQARNQALVIVHASRCVRRLIELVNLQSVLNVAEEREADLCDSFESQSAYVRRSMTA